MRLYCSTLLAVVTLFAVGTSVVTGDNDRNKLFRGATAGLPVVSPVLTKNERDSTARRVLRAVDDNEDDRAFGIPSMSTITETAMKIPGASTVAGLAKTLPGASMVGDLAQKMQYQYWLKMNKTPDEVKTILGLDDLGTKILDSPNLDIWIRYAKMYNERNNLPDTSMISELLKKIPSDRIMELVKKIPDSAKIIESVQYQYWLRMNKTPDEVKTILGLDNLGAKILDHPNVDIWVRYTGMYNKRKKLPDSSMISGLLKVVPTDKMMELVKKIPGSAKAIESVQHQYWLRMKTTPEEVKKLLGLDDLGAKILESPNLDIWIRYTRTYNERNNLPETAMIEDLLKMIPADRTMELAKKLPGSAKTIENVQCQLLLQMSKTPSEVKTLLGLDTLGTKLLDSPNLNIWIRFKRMYKQQHGAAAAA